MRAPRVPVDVLRREVENSGLSLAELARRLGWWPSPNSTAGGPDAHRVKRVLGLQARDNSHGNGAAPQRYVRAKTAESIRAVLNGADGAE